MKYIVIGLGYFGTSLATKLTLLGHEVIGIDNDPEKVTELKDRIDKVLIMDTSKPGALDSLPLSDVDAILVTIGEDIGSSILTLSLLKKFKVKRLIGRAINPTHHSILKEIGIDEIVHPEEDTATMVTSLLMVRNVYSILPVNESVMVAEIPVPARYVGHTLNTIDPENRFGIKCVAIKSFKGGSILGRMFDKDFEVDLQCDITYSLQANDRLLVVGDIAAIKRFNE
jgi:trk system potassium uptake protein